MKRRGLSGNAIRARMVSKTTLNRERVRQGRIESERPQVITNCDHLRFLCFRKSGHEVFGKPIRVPLHLLIEDACRYAVQSRQVGIQQDPLTAYWENDAFDSQRRQGPSVCAHAHASPP